LNRIQFGRSLSFCHSCCYPQRSSLPTAIALNYFTAHTSEITTTLTQSLLGADGHHRQTQTTALSDRSLETLVITDYLDGRLQGLCAEPANY
jgi:hypothetical protein